MPTAPHRLSFPRTDCGPEGRYAFGNGFRLSVLVACLFALGGAAASTWFALYGGPGGGAPAVWEIGRAHV